MSGDIGVEGHGLSPLYGPEGDKYAHCECGHVVTGLNNNELRDGHEQHLSGLVLKPGVAKARQALAETVARKQVAS